MIIREIVVEAADDAEDINESQNPIIDITPSFQNYQLLHVEVVQINPNNGIAQLRVYRDIVKPGNSPSEKIERAKLKNRGIFPLKLHYIKNAKVVQLEEQLVQDDYNSETVRPGFKKERWYQGRYLMIATARDFDEYDMTDRVRGLIIKVYDPKTKSTWLRMDGIAGARFIVTGDHMEVSMVRVSDEYQRQGIASAMYNFARELGNDIKPSRAQTDQGRAFWAAGAGQGRSTPNEPPPPEVKTPTAVAPIKKPSIIDRLRGFFKEDGDIEENFADGKNPGRKGLAKRVGVNCKQSVSKLRSIAKNSSGERQRMAHWCANMKSGKKKSNEAANDPKNNFVKFMNKSLGNRVDPTPDQSHIPDFIKNAPEMGLDEMGHGDALRWVLSVIQKMTPEQRQQLALKGDRGVTKWFIELAIRLKLTPKYGTPEGDKMIDTGNYKFVEEDIDEAQAWLPQIFHDPNIKSYLDVLQSGK